MAVCHLLQSEPFLAAPLYCPLSPSYLNSSSPLCSLSKSFAWPHFDSDGKSILKTKDTNSIWKIGKICRLSRPLTLLLYALVVSQYLLC